MSYRYCALGHLIFKTLGLFYKKFQVLLFLMFVFFFFKIQVLPPLSMESDPHISYLVESSPTNCYQLPLAVKTRWHVKKFEEDFSYEENIWVCNINSLVKHF